MNMTEALEQGFQLPTHQTVRMYNRKTKEFVVVPMPMACKHCKHWVDCPSIGYECVNQEVRGLVEADAGFMLMTKPDFGCNKWEERRNYQRRSIETST